MSLSPIARLQAVLFAAPHPLDKDELVQLLNAAPDEVDTWLAELQKELLENEHSGLFLERVAGGYRLATKPELGAYVENVTSVVKAGTLSPAALETLAIIAYKQPITRAEIEAIRGVRVERALTSLLERDLITEVGRKDAPGRPVLFGTTETFLAHFGLNTLNDLPQLDENDS